MDSKALLDYALFQLTPTRTRCDLVVFSGKISDKIASGLVEPFVSHLKYAKDEISKGGYSITLRVPVADDASWFTKATFQRFVRFVSTPEILESIIRIEREISQIEGSIQSNEVLNKDVTEYPVEGNPSAADGIIKKSNNSSKLPSEEIVNGASAEENSRVRLQRLLDSRKALLQKEQAMAYARAVVAGYEMDNIDDLIFFADTFGASRLREACNDFKELYMRKHSDDQWVDELAAVQARAMADLSYLGGSGILLAGENIQSNGISSIKSDSISESGATPISGGSKVNNQPASEQPPMIQPQLPWMNQIPQYMYNFQSPMHQTPSSYQGFPFPGMQPYYPGHMGWPPPGGIIPQSDNDQSRKLSRKKENSLDAEGPDTSEEYIQGASSDSYSGTDSDEVKEKERKHSSKRQTHAKKNKKNSSKTVVIRNINYITSQKHNGDVNEVSDSSSGRTTSIDEASIREGVDSALAYLDLRVNSKARKDRGERETHMQNGSNGYTDQDSRNDFDSSVSYGGVTTNAWDAFQNLLMSQEEPVSNGPVKHHPADTLDEHYQMNLSDRNSRKSGNALNLEFEKIKIQPMNSDDSVLAIQRGGGDDGTHTKGFMNGEHLNSTVKRTVARDENVFFSRQFEESRTTQLGTPADFAVESSVVKHPKGENWFVHSSGGPRAGNSKQLDFDNHGAWSYEGSHVRQETSTMLPADDSFIIQSRLADGDQYVSHWRTDLSMVPEIDKSDQSENRSSNISGVGISASAEPDDLCMVLIRESQESTGASWTPEMDYQLEISLTEANKKSSTDGHIEKELLANGKSVNGKKTFSPTAKRTLAGSLANGKPDPLSKNKKMPSASRSMVHKSKSEKDEEERKRKEESLIERHKRIAERTAARGLNQASKKVSVPWK